MSKRIKTGALIGLAFVLWHLFLVSSKWYLGPAGDYTYLLMILVLAFGILVQFRNEKFFDKNQNGKLSDRFVSAITLSLSAIFVYFIGIAIIHFGFYTSFAGEVVELKRQLLMESVASDPSRVLNEEQITNQLQLLRNRFEFPGIAFFFLAIPAFQAAFISILMAAISSKK